MPLSKVQRALAKIDELSAAITREGNKPLTGYAGSAREALALVRAILAE